MSGDTIERAIRAATHPVKGPSYDNLTGAQTFKHLACPTCHYHKPQKIELNGKPHVKCKKCGGIFERFTVQKMTGVRVAETRAKIIGTFFDDEYNTAWLKKCRQHVQVWFRYAHMREYNSNRELFDLVTGGLAWDLYAELWPKITVNRSESEAIVSARLRALCPTLVRSLRPNQAMPSPAELSRLIRCDKASFNPGKRWDRIVRAAGPVVAAWDAEIMQVFEAQARA